MNGTILEYDKANAVIKEKYVFDSFLTELSLESLLNGSDVFEKVNVLQSELVAKRVVRN